MGSFKQDQKILLTGASGFIGNELLKILLQRGYSVHVLTHSRSLPTQPNLTQHPLDICNAKGVEQLLSSMKFTHLLHFAWYVGEGCMMSPRNVEWLRTSIDLIQNFIRHGGRHFLGAGSCVEYDYHGALMREEETPLSNQTFYGACKNALCNIARHLCSQNGLRFQWVRIFNLYGPGEKSRRLMPSVIRSCLRGEDVLVSTGEQFLDYLYVSDSANAIADVFENELTDAVNISSGYPMQVRAIIETIARLTSYQGKIRYGALAPAFAERFLIGDNSKLLSIGWKPHYSLEEGLKLSIKYWQGMCGV